MSRVPELLPVSPCLILVPLLIFGLKTRLRAVCALLLGMALCLCALQVEFQLRETLASLDDVPANDEVTNDEATNDGITLVGMVTGMPMVGEHAVRFQFRLLDSGARVRLYWYEKDTSVEPGQVWRFRVRLREPTGAVNFDAFDYERWLFTKRIHALGYVVPNSDHELLAVKSSVDRIRHHIRQHLEQVVPLDAIATFLALALGDTSQLNPDDWSVLNHTGTTHLLIVSGLHVGLIATLTFLLCRVMGVGYSVAALSTVTMAAAYALLAGWGLPVQRALIMTAVYLACGLLARNISLLSRLALAAAFVVILDPLASLSVGFWLSFSVVASLILGLSNRFGYEKLNNVWGSQWVAFIALLPLLAGFNHQLPLVSLPVNIIAIPVVGFVLVPLILLSLVVSFISVPVGALLIGIAQMVTGFLWQQLELAAGWGALVNIAVPEIWRVILALCGAALILMPRGLVPRWLGVPLLLLLLAQPERLQHGVLRVTFLDVGQGLSVLLESRSAATLYDTGPSFPGAFSAAEQIVLPAVRGRGWQDLAQLIISHADNDHAGGKQSILGQMPVKRLIEQGNCDANWERDGLWFASFAVDEGTLSRNDASCLLLVVVGRQYVLLTGDLEDQGEQALLSRLQYLRLKIPMDVVSVPHHGSHTSSTPGFLNRMLPTIAVVSAGYENRFGHPDDAVVRRYEHRYVRLLSTAESGAVEITLEPHGMIIAEARAQASGIWRRHGNHRQAGND